MADQQIGSSLGVAASGIGDADSPSNLSGTVNPQQHPYGSNENSIFNMRTRLAAIDAGYYTEDKLNEMTYNDMVYAIRVNDHPSTIKQ